MKWPSDVRMRELILLLVAAENFGRPSSHGNEILRDAFIISESRNDVAKRAEAHEVIKRLGVSAEVSIFMDNWIEGRV